MAPVSDMYSQGFEYSHVDEGQEVGGWVAEMEQPRKRACNNYCDEHKINMKVSYTPFRNGDYTLQTRGNMSAIGHRGWERAEGGGSWRMRPEVPGRHR